MKKQIEYSPAIDSTERKNATLLFNLTVQQMQKIVQSGILDDYKKLNSKL